ALMPRDIAEQMSQVQRLFQQSALQPMQNLATRLQQGADPKNAPEMKRMQSLSSGLQKELESLQSRLRALAKARRNMRGDIDDALARLRRDLLKENTSLTARELEELREHIAKLREELKRLGVSQEQLLQEKGAEDDPRTMEKKQDDLGKQLARLLAEAKNLLGDSKTRRMKRPPDFPNAPYDPDTKEQKVPPKEEDTDEGDATKKSKDKKAKQDAKTAKVKNDKKDDDEEEPLFMPGLGGPKPKLDPRFAKKLRPTKPKAAKKDGDSASDPRSDRQSREEQALQELDMAQQ